MDAAARAAAYAFELRTANSGLARAQLLQGLAAALEGDREALVSLAEEETGLGPVRLNGELDRTAFQLRRFADIPLRGVPFEVLTDPAVACPPPAGHRSPGHGVSARALGAKGHVLGQQLSVCLLRARGQHGLRPGRWLPGGAFLAPGGLAGRTRLAAGAQRAALLKSRGNHGEVRYGVAYSGDPYHHLALRKFRRQALEDHDRFCATLPYSHRMPARRLQLRARGPVAEPGWRPARAAPDPRG